MDDIYELQFQKEELERENGLLKAKVAMLESIAEDQKQTIKELTDLCEATVKLISIP